MLHGEMLYGEMLHGEMLLSPHYRFPRKKNRQLLKLAVSLN